MALEKIGSMRALELLALANAQTQETEEFCRIKDGLFDLIVCTSLDDVEATVRVNLVPSGTTRGWVLAEGSIPCDTDPETHRHILFEC